MGQIIRECAEREPVTGGVGGFPEFGGIERFQQKARLGIHGQRNTGRWIGQLQP